jgi:type IV secretory pathway VirB10-like protein
MKAIQDAEIQALAEVPDPTELIQIPASAPFIPQPVQTQVHVPVQQAENINVSKEDIIAIRSQLERVNATLTKMSGMLGKVFNTFNEKNRNNQ